MAENQKLHEVLQHAIEDLSSATGFLTGRSRERQSKTVEALAKLQADIIALPTATPVGERELFERTMMDKYGWQHEDFKLDDFGYADGQTDTAWMAWQARAALSAGDAVLAEREACAKLCEEVADDLITAMRKEGETDDEVMTSLVASVRVCAEEIRGGYSKKFNPHNAAIDAAMRKDNP